MKKKLAAFRKLKDKGRIDEEAIKRSLVSYRGHLSHGNTYGLIRKLDEFESNLKSD